jgi:disabled family protein 2
MSDTTVPSPVPSPEPSTKSNNKKFEGEGISFKGKLIGMEDLSIDRDEKICLDSMFKLKAVVRARGEHKQKIQLNLTMSAVKIIDEHTKVFIYHH